MAIECEIDPPTPAAWRYVLWGVTHHVCFAHGPYAEQTLRNLGVVGPFDPSPLERLWDNDPPPDPTPPAMTLEQAVTRIAQLEDELAAAHAATAAANASAMEAQGQIPVLQFEIGQLQDHNAQLLAEVQRLTDLLNGG